MFKDYNDFIDICKMIANEQHTLIKCNVYEEYKFATASFMTDQFGGNYCNIKYDFKTGEVIDTFFDNKKFDNLSDLIIHITVCKEQEEKLRNLDEIYNLVNSEH